MFTREITHGRQRFILRCWCEMTGGRHKSGDILLGSSVDGGLADGTFLGGSGGGAAIKLD